MGSHQNSSWDPQNSSWDPARTLHGIPPELFMGSHQNSSWDLTTELFMGSHQNSSWDPTRTLYGIPRTLHGIPRTLGSHQNSSWDPLHEIPAMSVQVCYRDHRKFINNKYVPNLQYHLLTFHSNSNYQLQPITVCEVWHAWCLLNRSMNHTHYFIPPLPDTHPTSSSTLYTSHLILHPTHIPPHPPPNTHPTSSST